MKLKAREFSIEDIEKRVEWINNPKINSTMNFDLPATYDKTLLWYNNIICNENRIDFTILDETMNPVAMGGFSPINKSNANAEFYIMVNPDMFGMGVGYRVSNWLYNYGFIHLKLNKIYLYTYDDNLAANRIYEKSGFVLEGVLREQNFKKGEFVDRRFYGLLKKDWEIREVRTKSVDYEF